MSVIVTRHTGSVAGSGSGSGVYTQLEKLSLEMEMEFKAAQLYNYKEFGYSGNSLVSLDIYVDDVYLFTHTVITTNRSGQSGVMTSNSGAYFDDFKLTVNCP